MSQVPPALQLLGENDLLQTVRATVGGDDLHLVGGALRDSYLGLAGAGPEIDIDLVVAGKGQELASRLASNLGARLVLLGGERFAAYRLVHVDFTIDIWDRLETSIFSDLERRDFTINAIALGLHDGSFHDPFDGLGDLESRTLRAVTEASLTADPLRVLRLVRFALLLPGFSIEPNTLDLARAAAPLIPEVASERVREELAIILGQGRPTKALELLTSVDLFPRLWGQVDIDAKAIEHLNRTLGACERAEAQCREVDMPNPDHLLCVHALIARVLGTSTASQTASLLTRSQGRTVIRLSRIDPFEMSRDLRRFLARWGNSWIEAAVLTGALQDGRGLPIRTLLDSVMELVQAEGRKVLDPQPILDGKEIQDLLGLPPGPQIGQLLEALLDAQLRGEVTDRETATTFLRECSGPAGPANDSPTFPRNS